MHRTPQADRTGKPALRRHHPQPAHLRAPGSAAAGAATLNELVERALALVRHQLELQAIELEKDLAPDLPPISCDAEQFQQVVLVLLRQRG